MKTVREALNRAMREEMERDPNVFLLGEEVGHYHGAYKVSAGLLEKFGERRVLDTPIAEGGFAGIGIGAAMAGLRPIVEFMTWNFSLVAIDQIVNNAAKLRYMSGGQIKVPIVFRGPQGAGGALAAQHSQVFENYYTYVPGLLTVAPSNPKDAYGLLKTAIRNDNPVIFLESEKLYNVQGELPEEEFTIEFGKANIVQEGNDVTILTWSYTMQIVLEAVALLEKENISVELIDVRSLHPLDEDTIIKSVQKTNHAVIVQEAWPIASFGDHLTRVISTKAFDYLDAPVELISSKPVPMPYSFPLEEATLPSAARVVKAVKRCLS